MLSLYRIFISRNYITNEYIGRFAKSKFFLKKPNINEELLVKFNKELHNITIYKIDSKRKILYTCITRFQDEDYEQFMHDEKKKLSSLIERLNILESKFKATEEYKMISDFIDADLSMPSNVERILTELNNGIKQE